MLILISDWIINAVDASNARSSNKSNIPKQFANYDCIGLYNTYFRPLRLHLCICLEFKWVILILFYSTQYKLLILNNF